MTKTTTKKTFVSEKSTAMLHLLGSYLAFNKNKEEILILAKFSNKFDQIINTKNKHEATIGMQSHVTSTANDLTNSPDLGLTSLYMDANAKTYNVPWVEKIKTFDFLDDSLNNSSQIYNTVIFLFNYLDVDISKNFLYKKIVQSDRVARAEAEFKDDIQKRGRVSKHLFVDGEQRTLKDYTALIANLNSM